MRGPEQSGCGPTVVIVDCCTQVRASFQCCFPSLVVVGTFAAVEELLDCGVRCDLVILDVGHDGAVDGALSGPPAIEALIALGYRVCVFSAERRVLMLARCLAAGATGLVGKSDSLVASEEAFVTVARGGIAIAAAMEEAWELVRRRGVPPQLTMRQRQVLHARARGESWQGLAARLGISAKTAYDRLECVRAKLTWFLQDAGLGPDASPADIEYALGLGPASSDLFLAQPGDFHRHRAAGVVACAELPSTVASPADDGAVFADRAGV